MCNGERGWKAALFGANKKYFGHLRAASAGVHAAGDGERAARKNEKSKIGKIEIFEIEKLKNRKVENRPDQNETESLASTRHSLRRSNPKPEPPASDQGKKGPRSRILDTSSVYGCTSFVFVHIFLSMALRELKVSRSTLLESFD